MTTRFSETVDDGKRKTFFRISLYLVELGLPYCNMLKYLPSLQAAAGLYLTLRFANESWVRLQCKCTVFCTF